MTNATMCHGDLYKKSEEEQVGLVGCLGFMAYQSL